ncbi:MAG: methylmalonyl Co-A mutase-associated GTPase MeaB [Desulfobacterales bacterium]
MFARDPEYYIQGILSGDKRILSKTITLVESSLPGHQELARNIIDALLSRTGSAIRLGITGVPGVGKSTFIESLGTFLTKRGSKVAVLAVDPSSKRSGGSILADKTRMEKLSVEDMAFIRPSPSGGTLGGVARKTRETMLICEAFGFDVIIVETVGVGQSETSVASMVDFFLVLMLAGAGDELQGIKKGVLEMADAVAVNKADGDNIEKAEHARSQYEKALHFLNPASKYWTPPVMSCSAVTMNGIDRIWDSVIRHRDIMTQTGELDTKRKKQAIDWMWTILEEGLRARFNQNEQVKKKLPQAIHAVETGYMAPTAAAMELLTIYDDKQPE